MKQYLTECSKEKRHIREPMLTSMLPRSYVNIQNKQSRHLIGS